jgi:Ice-binding-like
MMKFIALLLIFLVQFIFVLPQKVFAATSPSLGAADSYSVLGKAGVTNTGNSVISGNVGADLLSAMTGFALSTSPGPGIVNGSLGLVQAPTVNGAEAAVGTAYNALSTGDNETCTSILPDLTGQNLVPGVYCAGTFSLSGTLTLSGSGVWIFQSAATLITSGTANIVGGDPCNVWWKVVSSATLGSSTSLIGNVLASTSISMANGASLNGRAFAQTGAVTLINNAISGPTCAAAATPTPTTSASTSTSTSSNNASCSVCPTIKSGTITPTIIESKRIDADSIFISWGPYSGTDTFNVRYGLTNGNWLYNTNVTGFSTTLNALPPNQPIWVEVAARNDYMIGAYGESMLVGGPGLPNTGRAPHERNIPLFIASGIFVGISVLLIFFQRKHRCLSK